MRKKEKNKTPKKKRSRKIRKFIIPIILIALVVYAYSSFMNQTDVEIQTQNYYTVQKTDLFKSVNISGEVASDSVDYVYSGSQTKVESISVKVGDRVTKDTVICTFDTSDLQKELDNYNKLLKDFDEYNKMVSENKTNKVNYQQNHGNAQLNEMQNKINSAQARYDEAAASRDDYKAKADAAEEESKRLQSVMEELQSDCAELLEKYPFLDPQANLTDEMREQMMSKEDSKAVQEASERYTVIMRDIKKNSQLKKNADSEKAMYEGMYESSKDMVNALDKTLATYRASYQQMKIENDMSLDLAREEQSYSKLDADTRNGYTEHIAELQKEIDSKQVKAETDGIVTDVFVTEGDYIPDGIVCCIQNFDELHFEAYALPENVSDISTDCGVLVKFASNNYEDVEGKILSVDNYFNKQKGGYLVTFTVDNIEKYSLYPGFTAAAKVLLDERRDVLAVPYDSIMEIEGKDYVMKVVNQMTGETENVEVEKGLETDYYVEVKSDNLNENDMILD